MDNCPFYPEWTTLLFVQYGQLSILSRVDNCPFLTIYISGYGKQAENVLKHTNTHIFTEDKDLEKRQKKPFYRTTKEVYDENDQLACYIVKMDKKNIKDSKPVHIGVSILQWSKVLFIKFMYWLEEHLEEGAFKTCYADTDSMALALTRSGPEHEEAEQNLRSLFDPMVKPAKKESWEATWKDWFVTTDEIWDIRKPGKLKGK